MTQSQRYEMCICLLRSIYSDGNQDFVFRGCRYGQVRIFTGLILLNVADHFDLLAAPTRQTA